MDKLIVKLEHFVKRETSGRHPSHGYDHMKVVYENALLIMKNMNLTQNQRRWAIIVAWLHDVADHKYDLDGTIMNNVILFIEKIEPTPNYIIECIKAVSFSTEKRMGYKHYENTLPPEWVIVRNIASDADKMEALGKMGVVRCIQYAQEQYEKKSEKSNTFSSEYKIDINNPFSSLKKPGK